MKNETKGMYCFVISQIHTVGLRIQEELRGTEDWWGVFFAVVWLAMAFFFWMIGDEKKG